MRNDEDLESAFRQFGEPAAASRLLALLREYAGERLSTDELPVHRIQQSLRDTYIQRALDESTLLAGADDTHVFNVLANAIDVVIERDRRYVAEMIRDADWDDVTGRVLIYAATKHGTNVKRHGRSVEDYYQEAFRQLVTFRRHYPYYRDEGLTLTAWLCEVMNSLISHDAEKNAREGTPVSIVRKLNTEWGAHECSENHLPAVPSDQHAAEVAETKAAVFTAALPSDLAAYAEERMDHPEASTKERAAVLGTTVEQVRAMDKRLRRRLRLWPRDAE